jgi:hypothetical protein
MGEIKRSVGTMTPTGSQHGNFHDKGTSFMRVPQVEQT